MAAPATRRGWRGGTVRQLGQLEARVMTRVWTHRDPLTVRQVHDLLQDEHPVAYTTVLTVMDNLHGKGLLGRVRSGRAFLYSASLSREEYGAELMADVLAGSTNRSATLLRFVDHIPADEAADLRHALEARTRQDGGRTSV
jgi:predicted transcriptional regulator